MWRRWRGRDGEEETMSRAEAPMGGGITDVASGVALDGSGICTSDEATVEVVLYGLPYRCWRCGEVSTALVGLARPCADLFSEDLIGCDDEIPLSLAWEHLPEDAKRRLHVGEVRRRYSRALGAEYLSNGCASCDALFGEHFLHEELTYALATDGASALIELAVVEVSQSSYVEAFESRWS